MGCKAYKDGIGYPTIGIGKECVHIKVKTNKEAESKCDTLIDKCKKEKNIEYKWLREDIDKKMNCISHYENLKKAYDKCSVYRKAILISMCYQMECEGVSKFKKALKYMYEENWEKAAKEMLDSEWYKKKTNLQRELKITQK